jgi:hypothetical protein
MLTDVHVASPGPGVPYLSLGAFYPNDNPIFIKDIAGLEPVKAEITTATSNQDGDLFQNARLGKRNIVFQLGLNPNWIDQNMSSLRHMLYRYFLPTFWRQLWFYSDNMPTVNIWGNVESFEPNMFSQDPEIQISVLCPRPKFIGLDGVTEYAGL